MKHVGAAFAIAVFILLSGHAAAYHDEEWCLGYWPAVNVVNMADCVVWEDYSGSMKYHKRATNICNKELSLDVCWTGKTPDSNYTCDYSHPIPPAGYADLDPGESTLIDSEGHFWWWAYRCEE